MSDSKKDRSLEFAAYHMHALSYPVEKAGIVRSRLLKEWKEAKKNKDFQAFDRVLQEYNVLLDDMIRNIQEHQKKALGHLPEEDVEKSRVRREAENASCIRNQVKADRAPVEVPGFEKALGFKNTKDL